MLVLSPSECLASEGGFEVFSLKSLKGFELFEKRFKSLGLRLCFKETLTG